MTSNKVGLSRRALMRGAAITSLATLAAATAASATQADPAGEPHQSPIRIKPGDTRTADLPALHFDYPSDATVTMKYVREDADEPHGCTSRGEEETVRAELAPGTGSVTVGGVTYALAQFHWHTPSEHLVPGENYPIEMHFVHQDASGHILVIGVWVRPGPAHPTLGRLYDHLVEECTPSEEVSHIDVGALLPDRLTSYRYDGSLTTSPYSEGIQWVLLEEPITASPRQIAQFRMSFPTGNRREVQDLNDRTVLTDGTRS